jgi:multimeric flavodoxin WrbA
MKKITALIGSPHLLSSNTLSLTQGFLQIVQTIEPSIETEIISLGAQQVGFCKGCWHCTRMGSCALKDDLPLIQQKLLESDMIILGSPVYVEQVSAQMKAFIDRIFIWLHTLRLIGKPSLTVVTTAGSGIQATENYLNNVLYLLGTIPIGHLRGIAFRPSEFPKREETLNKYQSLAIKTAAILNGEKALHPTLKNQLYFWAMKSKAHFGATYLPYENEFWKKSGWNKMTYSQAAKTTL